MTWSRAQLAPRGKGETPAFCCFCTALCPGHRQPHPLHIGFALKVWTQIFFLWYLIYQNHKEKHYKDADEKTERLKDYSTISRLKWCHWNCNGISSLDSAADATVLCVAKHFKLLVSYTWLGITKPHIFLLYYILEPHLSGLWRKCTLPSSHLVIKIFIFVQKPPNQFDLEIKLLWSPLTWIYSRLSRIICLSLSNSLFLSLIFIFLISCLNTSWVFGFFAITYFVSFCLRWDQYYYITILLILLYCHYYQCGVWFY